MNSKITYFQIFAFLSYTITFVSNLASVLFESRYWSGKGDFKVTNEYHDNYKYRAFFNHFCVRYPHAVPFLRNEMPNSLLKTPKTHFL